MNWFRALLRNLRSSLMEVYLITRRCPMRAYIERNGHHFNERLCDFAVSHLRTANGTDRHRDAKEVLGILAAADYKLDEDEYERICAELARRAGEVRA